MLFYGFWDVWNERNLRFKPKDRPKSVTPPALPPPTPAPPSEISPQVQAAGQAEGRKLTKKTGRRATRLTRPSLAFVPAQTAQAGLKTKLGATV